MSSTKNKEPAGTADLPTSPPSAEPTTPRDSWHSEELLGPRREVQILHNGEIYHLRRTRQGKLILYK